MIPWLALGCAVFGSGLTWLTYCFVTAPLDDGALDALAALSGDLAPQDHDQRQIGRFREWQDSIGAGADGFVHGEGN